jgi:DNA-binding XRE family transcriptional regulator
MTQEQMAERAGVTRKTYQALEGGKKTSSLTLLMRVMAVFEYPDRIPDFLASDPMGEDLEEIHGRRRASADRGFADF